MSSANLIMLAKMHTEKQKQKPMITKSNADELDTLTRTCVEGVNP